MSKPTIKSAQSITPDSAPAPLIPPVCIMTALLVAMTILLYWPALQNGFVNYDDDRYVTANERVQGGLTLDNIGWAFSHTVADNWHPVTVLSHMLVYQFCGLKPWGHHFVNVLLHAVNAGLVFILFRRMTGALWKSFFVAALFAVHPLRVESVAWIAERKDVLSGLFGLLTLIFYAVHAQTQNAGNTGNRIKFSRAYRLALVCFALGLMSKPMLVTWPFVLLLLDYWPLGRISNVPSPIANLETSPRQLPSITALLLEKVPFFVLAIAASIVTFIVQQQGAAVETMQNLPLAPRLANAIIAYCRYLEKTAWPADLAVFYMRPIFWPLDYVLPAAAFLVGFTIFVLVLRKRQPYLLTGWFWFLGTLIPVIGLVQVGLQSIADRYTYLPSLGILICLIWGAEALLRGVRSRTAILMAGGLAAIVAFSLVTRAQLPYWRDGETLFRHAIAVAGDNPVVNYNLGVALDAEGRSDEAIREYKTVLELQPTNTLALLNLGGDLYKVGEPDGALAEYQEVIRLEPNNDKARNDLGIVFFKQGRMDDAINEFREAVRLAPGNPSAHNSLAAALFTQGLIDAAIPEFQEAVRLKPDYAEAHFNLGCILAKRGQTSEAINHLQAALRINPNYTEARDQLTKIQAAQGK